jgi:hypothetical protein
MDRAYDSEHGRFGDARVGHFWGNGWGGWGNHWRYGYCGYPGWIDADFFFGAYLYSPFIEPCVVSPWYWYPCLPPYIPEERVEVVDNAPPVDWDSGQNYDYHPFEDNMSYGNHELNCAVGQIRNIFNHQLESAIDYLIPEGSQIAIYNEGKYMYTLKSSDFRAMMKDNMDAVKTISFEVTYVRIEGDSAIVKCRHAFEDPESGQDTIYQMYRLKESNGRYRITDFMTSKNEIHQDFF